MDPRKPNSITMMIAQARRKLDEAKELQFFGGDALNLKRFTHTFTVPSTANPYECFSIVLTPTEPEYTMPIDVGIKPATATSYGAGKIERVPRTDGKFEYIIMFDNWFSEDKLVEFYVVYSGAANVAVTRLY